MTQHITMHGMILVHEATLIPVTIGEVVTDFRGDKAIVTGGRTYGNGDGFSSGRVSVREDDSDWQREYYPSVFDLKWVPEQEAANAKA